MLGCRVGTGARRSRGNLFPAECHKDLRRVIREACAGGKTVAAICLSPVVLARAGCLDSKEATVFPDPEAVQDLEAAGAKYVDRSVVVAGNVVTARAPDSVEEFARAVILTP